MDRIAVIGGGLVGCTAALALARSFPRRVVHIAPDAPADERTTALLMDSIALLEELGVWHGVEASAAPLRTMRLLDGSRRLFRTRPLDFSSAEVGLAQFGYNIRNDALLATLDDAGNVDRRRTTLDAITSVDGRWKLRLSDGSEIDAAIVVGADGRSSSVRQGAMIGARRWSYPQTALVTTFAHDRPHAGISAEWHTETGPFTQVPLPANANAENRSSLVWVVKPEDVEALTSLELETLSRRIAERTQYMFGGIRAEAPLHGYPLEGLTADSFGRDGALLVGEAAHVFPPIGAQGANLGFRDIRDCVRSIEAHSDTHHASGAYDRARRADIRLRTMAVDALNRSLLTDFLPVQAARAAGTRVLSGSDVLRRTIMRWGLSPETDRREAARSS